MNVSSILDVKGSHVQTVAADATIAEAAATLARHRIGALVVNDDGNALGGMISERDIVRGLVEHGPRLLEMRVATLMTPSVITCRRDDPIEHVMATMTHRRIRHVPVVDGSTLVGLVSIGDVVKQRLDELEAEAHLLREFITQR